MNIEFPQLPAIYNAIAQIQTDAGKFRKLADEICRPYEDIGGIAKKVRMPDVKVPQGLAKAIASTNRIQETFNAINHYTIELAERSQASFDAAQVLANRYEAKTWPAFDHHRKLLGTYSRAQAILDKSIQLPSVPRAILAPQHDKVRKQLETIRPPSIAPKPSPATGAVESVIRRFEERKRTDGDIRHDVVLVVNLMNGKWIRALEISAEGDALIRIVGEDTNGQRHEVLTGVASFQCQIITVEHPPPGAQLSVVK